MSGGVSAVRTVPDQILRTVSAPVGNMDTTELRARMADTMEAVRAVGLAAVQIGEPVRLIAIDMSVVPREDTRYWLPYDLERDRFWFLSDPICDPIDGLHHTAEEGCVSLLGYTALVRRPAMINVTRMTPDGRRASLEVSGKAARVIQHEIDHLNGILFIDRTTPPLREVAR